MKFNKLLLTYDTLFAPLSFDIVMALAFCRAFSAKYGLAEKFDVQLVNSGYRSVGIEANYEVNYQKQKFLDVIVNTVMRCEWVDSVFINREPIDYGESYAFQIPTSDMIEKRTQLPEWQVTPMVPNQLALLIEQGGTLSDAGFSASESEKTCLSYLGDKCITFHPRVSMHSPERNTNKNLATEVAEKLKVLGYTVAFVPDIEDIRAGFAWSDFPAEPLMQGAYSLGARVAVAEHSLMNLLWSGGAALPLYFSRSRFVVTGVLNYSNPISSPEFFARKGPVPNQQPNWFCEAGQIMDWTPTHELNAENLTRRLIEAIGAK